MLLKVSERKPLLPCCIARRNVFPRRRLVKEATIRKSAFHEIDDDGAIRNECLLHPDDPAPAQRPKFENLNRATHCVDLDATENPPEKPAGSKIEKVVEIESEYLTAST